MTKSMTYALLHAVIAVGALYALALNFFVVLVVLIATAASMAAYCFVHSAYFKNRWNNTRGVAPFITAGIALLAIAIIGVYYENWWAAVPAGGVLFLAFGVYLCFRLMMGWKERQQILDDWRY